MHCGIVVLWSDGKIRLALARVTKKSTRASLARSALRYAWHSTRADLNVKPVKVLFD